MQFSKTSFVFATLVGGAVLIGMPVQAENQSGPMNSVCVTKRCDVGAPREEQMNKLNPSGHRLMICAAGYTWQYGCLKWGPAQPGQLFGACLENGYGCFRAPEPIQ